MSSTKDIILPPEIELNVEKMKAEIKDLSEELEKQLDSVRTTRQKMTSLRREVETEISTYRCMKYVDEQLAQFIDRSNGMSWRDISKKHNRSESTIKIHVFRLAQMFLRRPTRLWDSIYAKRSGKHQTELYELARQILE